MQNTVRITVISNPAAGRGGGNVVRTVIRHLVEHGDKVELKITEHAGHAVEIARACAKNDTADLIVAAGGDGTVREVAAGLIGSAIPIGIIPAGTANVLARELGYIKSGRRNVRRTVAIIIGENTQNVHPFKVNYPATDGSVQRDMIGMCWVGVGFDAEVLKHVSSSLKSKLGRAAFVPAILKSLSLEPRVPAVPWEISGGITDGKADYEAGKCGWALIANIGRYAGPFQVTDRTSLSQPGLACLLFEKAGWYARAVDQLKIALKPVDDRGATRVLTEGSITLGDSGTPVQVDGDLVGNGPVTVVPMEAALRFKAAE